MTKYKRKKQTKKMRKKYELISNEIKHICNKQNNQEEMRKTKVNQKKKSKYCKTHREIRNDQIIETKT